MAVKTWTIEDFQEKLRELLTEDKDLCWNITSAAIGEKGDFEEYDFFDTDEFLSIFIEGRRVTETAENARRIIRGLGFGWDLDVGHSPANPDAAYLRWDGDAVDSTNNPSEYIYNEALEDIIDYVSENLDYGWYPEEVLELINEYKDNGGDLEV